MSRASTVATTKLIVKSPAAFRANGALKSFLSMRLTRSYERLTYARPFPCSIELDQARRFRRELELRPE